MPKRKPHPDDKIIEKKQKTNTGIYVNAGEIDHSDYDIKDWSDLQKDYTHMRDGHALIGTTIDILKFPILMSEYRLESKNNEAEDYVSWVYDNLFKGFDYLKRHKLLALDFGLSMHEMIVERGYKYNGKLTNRPIWFNPIQNETIDRFNYNEQTIFTGIKHERRIPEKANEFVDIEAKNIEYYTHNEEYNDIRGRSLLRRARFYWESEVKVVNSTVTGIQRGAGIPVVYTIGEPGDADKAKIEEIGRTICQLRNGYVAANKEKVEIDLLEPKGQQHVMNLLEWFDRHIFFNTLSQFMASGLGQNGSRSATAEHKSSYELAANYELQTLEVNFQQLTDRIMAMSYLAKIPVAEYPKFHFNAINQVDLTRVSGNVKTLLDSGAITKQREDEKSWREMFGMPELLITTEMVDPQEKPTTIFGEKLQLEKKEKVRNITVEKLKFEKEIFSLESANEHYDTIEEQVEKLLEKKFKEYFDDIKLQLNKDRKRDIHIRKSILETTIDEVFKLYEKGYERGERDVKTEIRKLPGVKQNVELQLTPKQSSKKKSIISKLITKLFTNTKTTIENKMNVVTDQFITKKGGLDEYLLGFETGFKKEKLNIKVDTSSGYIDGRGGALKDLSKEIKTFMYSSILNRSTCDECAPFDGQIFAGAEIIEAGLNFLSPVNPFCLGGFHSDKACKCQWIAYEYGRE